MTTTQAPDIGQITELLEEVHSDDRPMEVHLYETHSLGPFTWSANRTLCGIPWQEDPHCEVHLEEGFDIKLSFWGNGEGTCNVCGAPICLPCRLAAEAKGYEKPNA